MPHYNGFVCQTNFMRLIQYLSSTSIIFSKKTKRFMERNWRNRWVHKLLIGEVQTLAYFYSKLMIYRLYEFHRILICNSECFLFTQKVCKLHQIVKYILFNRFWFVEILKKKVQIKKSRLLVRNLISFIRSDAKWSLETWIRESWLGYLHCYVIHSFCIRKAFWKR